MRLIVSAVALTIGLVGLAGPARAQSAAELDEGIRLSGHFGIGVGGEQQVSTSTAPGTARPDMDPSIYIGGRIGSVVHPWIAVGGELQVQLWRNETLSSYSSRFDFDGFAKIRHAYDIGEHALEAYVIVPVGFTLATANQDNVNPGPGFNVGALVGAWFFLTEHYAMSLEVGWIYHHSYHNFDNFPGDATLEFADNQAVILIGGAFR